jgi:hypothetical protein
MRPTMPGALLLLAALNACGDDATGPVPSDGELRVLFIGNSLTYTNDVPALVATVAEAAGHSIGYGSITQPNFSLEDHWVAGVAEAIRNARADVVVLQQGPSSLPENQAHLREWSERLSGPIREAGGRPALYMVWPSQDRLAFFDAVRDSYLAAATAVDGLFMPAGEAWRTAWAVDPTLQLYGPDGFHPSRLGSIIAALTIYAVLFDAQVADLPTELVPTSSELETIRLDPAIAEIVYPAVDNTVSRFNVEPASLPSSG